MNDDQTNNIVLAHLAGYTAIANRNVAYVAASFSLFPLLVLFIALVAPLQISITEKVWRDVLGAEALAVAWYYCVWEQYTNCHYMECVLKPMVGKLLGQAPFWNYEEYKAPLRNRAKVIGDLWAAVFVSVCFL